VGRREQQWRVVGPEADQPLAGRRDRRAEGVEAGVCGGPAQERGGNAITFEDSVVLL
jgi:hypothetical protein